jgi:hypothetical protein
MSRQAKSEQPNEYANFETALKKVLSVPHSAMKSALAIEKRKKAKKSSASRASNETD